MKKLFNKKRKGSLVVEATLVFPLVLITLLFIANILNICMINVCMQQALNNAAKKISQNSYLVYRLAGEDAYKEFIKSFNEVNVGYDGFSESVKNTNEKMDNFQSTMKGTIESVETLKHTFDGFELNKAISYIEKLNENINGEKGIRNSIKETLLSSKSLFESLIELGESGKTNINSIVIKLLADSVGGNITGAISEILFNSYVDDINMPNKRILEVNSYHSSFNSDGSFTLVINYLYENPFSFVNKKSFEYTLINREIRMMNAITIKPFIGRAGTSLKGKFNGEEVEEYVYIPGSAYNIVEQDDYISKYHIYRDCVSLRGENKQNNMRRVKLSEAKESDRLGGLCQICENRKKREQRVEEFDENLSIYD